MDYTIHQQEPKPQERVDEISNDNQNDQSDIQQKQQQQQNDKQWDKYRRKKKRKKKKRKKNSNDTKELSEIEGEEEKRKREERERLEKIAKEKLSIELNKRGYVKHLKYTHMKSKYEKYQEILKERAMNNITQPMVGNKMYPILCGENGCRDSSCLLGYIPFDYDSVLIICTKGHKFRFHCLKESIDTQRVLMCWERILREYAGNVGRNSNTEIDIDIDQKEGVNEKDEFKFKLSHDLPCVAALGLIDKVDYNGNSNNNEISFVETRDELVQDREMVNEGVEDEIKQQEKKKEKEKVACDGYLYCAYMLKYGKIVETLLDIPPNDQPGGRTGNRINFRLYPKTEDDLRIEKLKQTQERIQQQQRVVQYFGFFLVLFWFCFVLFCFVFDYPCTKKTKY